MCIIFLCAKNFCSHFQHSISKQTTCGCWFRTDFPAASQFFLTTISFFRLLFQLVVSQHLPIWLRYGHTFCMFISKIMWRLPYYARTFKQICDSRSSISNILMSSRSSVVVMLPVCCPTIGNLTKNRMRAYTLIYIFYNLLLGIYTDFEGKYITYFYPTLKS